jgi:hypothetical protein
MVNPNPNTMKNAPEEEENLNIEWHTKNLILSALNKCETTKEAAAVLGMSERNLFYLKAQYGIERVSRYVVKDQFEIVNTF